MSIDNIEIPLPVEEEIAQLAVNEVKKIRGKNTTWHTKKSIVRKTYPERQFKIFEHEGVWYIGRKKDKQISKNG